MQTAENIHACKHFLQKKKKIRILSYSHDRNAIAIRCNLQRVQRPGMRLNACRKNKSLFCARSTGCITAVYVFKMLVFTKARDFSTIDSSAELSGLATTCCLK